MGKKLIKLHTVKGETIAVFPGDFIIVDNGNRRSLYDDIYDYETNEPRIDVTESLDEIINLNNN